MEGINMSEKFRAGCEKFGITDDLIASALERSALTPEELLTIDTTTSDRNFKVSYLNKAGEKKWIHLFMVVPKEAVA